MTGVAEAEMTGWANRILASLTEAVEAIIEAGRLLIEAKEELGYRWFGRMIKEELPFGECNAQRLMQIARDPRIANQSHDLPTRWSTLYELAKLTDAEWDAVQPNHKTTRLRVTTIKKAVSGKRPPIAPRRWSTPDKDLMVFLAQIRLRYPQEHLPRLAKILRTFADEVDRATKLAVGPRPGETTEEFLDRKDKETWNFDA